MLIIEWFKYGGTILASLIGGGAMGAFINNWLTQKREKEKEKVPIIGVSQSITCVFATAPVVEAKITFTSEGKEFHFDNLYIAEIKILNEANTDYSVFDLKITLPPFAEIVKIDCAGQDASHEIALKTKVAFDAHLSSVDLTLNPLNKKNIYHITAYVFCKNNNRLTKNDINYSSKTSAMFNEVELLVESIQY